LFLDVQEEVLQLADPTPCSNSIGQCVEFRRDGFIAERMACSTGRCFNHCAVMGSMGLWIGKSLTNLANAAEPKLLAV
jgi:hypothetical protein